MDIDYKKLFTELGHQAVRATGMYMVDVNNDGFILSILNTNNDKIGMSYGVYIDYATLELTISGKLNLTSTSTLKQYMTDDWRHDSIRISMANPQFDELWQEFLQNLRSELKSNIPKMISNLDSQKRSINKEIDSLKRLQKRLR